MGREALDGGEVKLITFDCYGTLIDWQSGITAVLGKHLRAAQFSWDDRYFDMYLACEARQQGLAFRPYRDVLTTAEAEVLSEIGVPSPHDRLLADAVGTWAPFADTAAALRRLAAHYQLGVLSNVDRAMFEDTARQLGVKLDVLVTAEDVRSYKPHPAHFTRMLELTGLDRKQVLHAAQSLYHDIVPCNALSVPCVWINRRDEPNHSTARPLAEYSDVAAFADALLQ